MKSPEARFRREEVACNLCGSESREPLMEKDGWRIVRCAGCGLVFVSPRLPADALAGEVYGPEYFNAENGYGLEDHFGRGAREMKIRAGGLLDKIEDETKERRGALLDVGCAGGFFLEAARARGWKVSGLEISPYAARRARDEKGLEIITGDVSRDALPPAACDVVTLLDTLEHLSDPMAGLRNIHHALKTDGLLYCITPNFAGLPSRALGVRWGLVAPQHHLYYFTPDTLDRLLRRAGFTPLRWFYPRLGLADLFLSAGTLQALGVPVRAEHKQFVRRHLRGARDAVRKAADLLDTAVVGPVAARGRGGQMEVIAQRAVTPTP